MESELRSTLTSLDVENVYIYAADAVRYDFTPPKVARRGIKVKTIAGGIHSPTGFATLVSGLYAPQHGVHGFRDRLPTSAPSLLRTTTHDTAFVNTINHEPFNSNPASKGILANTLGTRDNPTNTIGEIEPPFVVLERGPGGHAPYGDFEGNAWEYFRERKGSHQSRFVREYEDAVQRDRQHFEEQLDRLKERGLLDDTLVIYTSDHGELLGEKGLLGHNGPIHRQLVEVPTVFVHPDLPEKTISATIVRHVDLAPTVSAVANVEFDGATQPTGQDLTSEEPIDIAASFHAKTSSLHSRLPPLTFSYDSVWDCRGGFVFPKSNAAVRLAAWMKHVAKSAKREFARKNAGQNFVAFALGEHCQGTPTIDRARAINYLESIRSGDVAKAADDLEVPTDRLRELGYLNA